MTCRSVDDLLSEFPTIDSPDINKIRSKVQIALSAAKSACKTRPLCERAGDEFAALAGERNARVAVAYGRHCGGCGHRHRSSAHKIHAATRLVEGTVGCADGHERSARSGRSPCMIRQTQHRRVSFVLCEARSEDQAPPQSGDIPNASCCRKARACGAVFQAALCENLEAPAGRSK